MPFLSATGVNVRLPASRSVFGTESPAVTAVPLRANVPAKGTVTMVTLSSVSAVSASVKLKSVAWNAYAVSSSAITVPSAAAGTVLGAGDVILRATLSSSSQFRVTPVHSA